MAGGGDLIEGPLSPRARPALERVARAMGEREGTRPEDDPITRSIVRQAEAKAHEDGHGQETAANVLAVLRARGIELTPIPDEDRALSRSVPGDALMAAAVACRDENDFRRRIREVAR